MALAWFVAYNTVQSAPTTSSPVGEILSTPPSGYESVHGGDVVDNAKFLAAAAATKLAGPAAAGQGPTISVENITWSNVNGPYATQAQANAAIPAIQKAEPAPGAAQEATAAAGISNPLNDIGDFFHRLTEAATWERVGEVAVGVLLLYIGVKALTQDTALAKSAKSGSSTGKKIIEALAVPK